jgi:choline dehydrogenase-like flavoprotein
LTRSPAERRGLAPAERALRAVAALLLLISLAAVGGYVWAGLDGPAEYPFVANSVAKDGLIAAGAALLLWDVRRFDWMATVLGLAHVLIVLGTAGMALAGRPLDTGHTIGDGLVGGATFVWLWAAAAAAMAVALLVLRRAAAVGRYDLRYLTPSGFAALAALAEVLVLEGDREVTAPEVAQRADHYLARFAAKGKWKLRIGTLALAWYPLLTLRPPLYMLSPESRRAFVRRRFLDEVADRAVPEWLRGLRQAMIRAGQQLCFLGYYGDPRGAATTGYRPFSQRPEFQAAVESRPRERRPVRSLAPADVNGDSLRADVVVIGSGAAGGMLAYELARRGREVLLLERGPHIDPSEFTEDEPTQLSNLYADGALTLSRDFRFQTLQGMCVGGSTVVNNAVCFDLPERVLDRWLDPGGLDAGLDPEALRRAFAHVRAFLPVSEASVEWPLNPGAGRVREGIRALDLERSRRLKLVDCNIADCAGCGYCNIGCAFGRKLSVLDTVLPRAQAEFGPDGVRVLAECRAEELAMEGWRATGVRCRLSDGRRVTVAADEVVVSAGALASSVLLQRSQLGDGRAGEGLAFNIASPMTFDFPEALHSERGLQISHYLEPLEGEELALETWFNPVVSQSLFMPGWFDDHRRNMRRYSHMTCLGPVVGSESNGRVSAGRRGGMTLDYTPTTGDFRRLVAGLGLAGRIGLAAGARRVMPASFRYMEINAESELARLDDLQDASDLSVNSSHPQGGNPISRNALVGVVDPDFRVYGTENVWCCDASVFPSSITVNPQLTVMALAVMAAQRVG